MRCWCWPWLAARYVDRTRTRRRTRTRLWPSPSTAKNTGVAKNGKCCARAVSKASILSGVPCISTGPAIRILDVCLQICMALHARLHNAMELWRSSLASYFAQQLVSFRFVYLCRRADRVLQYNLSVQTISTDDQSQHHGPVLNCQGGQVSTDW